MKWPATAMKRPALALQEPAPDHAATATHELQAEEELPFFLAGSIFLGKHSSPSSLWHSSPRSPSRRLSRSANVSCARPGTTRSKSLQKVWMCRSQTGSRMLGLGKKNRPARTHKPHGSTARAAVQCSCGPGTRMTSKLRRRELSPGLPFDGRKY